MIVGTYWDESQVAIVDIQQTGYQNGNWGFSAPALASSIIDKNGVLAGVVFVEAVPGSEHYGIYINPITLGKSPGNLVKVNIWEGADVKTMKQKGTDIWLLGWFGLTKLPPWKSPVISAYDHAMGVVSP